MWPLCLCVKTRINLLLEFKTWITIMCLSSRQKYALTMQATFVNCLIHLNHSTDQLPSLCFWIFKNKIFCIASFCWRNSKRAHVNCDVDDIFLCRNQLTFFRMRRSTSYGRQKFRKKVTLFVQFLITTFIP